MKNSRRWALLLAGLALLLGTLSWIPWARRARDRQRGPVDLPASGALSIAAAGDTLLQRPLDGAERDRVSGVVDLLRHSSLAVTNLELNLLGAETARAAANRPSPKWVYGTAAEASELKRLGFAVIVQANNHATDYGVDGMRNTSQILEQAGLLHAGAGDDLAAARAATFVGRGPRRVAVISVASSSAPDARASASHGEIKGRSGLNPLRYTAEITADPKTFATLRTTAELAGTSADGDQLTLFGTVIRKGARTTVDFSADDRDVSDILSQIRSARARAEFVVVSIHSHEPNNDSEAPADFIRSFARAAVDAGAGLVVGHGPHQLRGIEVYKHGAILYSLGNFLYQAEPIDDRSYDAFDAGLDMYSLAVGTDASGSAARLGVTSDRWWEGAVAISTLENGALTSLVMHPIDLGPGRAVDRRGTPRLAGPDRAAAILGRLERLSTPYGTRMRTSNGVAVVDLRPR